MISFKHIWILVFAAVACQSSEPYREEIQANAYLQKIILSRVKELDTLDVTLINSAREQKLEKLQMLESSIQSGTDTLDGPTALFLKDLAQSGEPYHPAAVEISRVEARLNHSHSQLTALNHDLSHNLLPKDSVGWMLREERRKANAAIDEIEILREKFDSEQLKAEIWFTRIDSFIEAQKEK